MTATREEYLKSVLLREENPLFYYPKIVHLRFSKKESETKKLTLVLKKYFWMHLNKKHEHPDE